MRKNRKLYRLITLLLIVFGFCSFVAQNNRPTLFIIGDSTVKTGRGDGSNGQWGWGSFIGEHIDLSRIDVRNKALGGTSSRTFYNNPKLWQQVLDSIRAGDYVIMQFGHNDSSPIVDTLRARGTIKGNGDEYQEVNNPLLKQREMVYSYGFYLRRFVRNIRDKGATAVICSPVPRNSWEGDKVRRSEYAVWAEEAARQSGALYVPLHELAAAEYEKLGKAHVDAHFFGPKDGTHTIKGGAILNAELVARYLQKDRQTGIAKYIKK